MWLQKEFQTRLALQILSYRLSFVTCLYIQNFSYNLTVIELNLKNITGI